MENIASFIDHTLLKVDASEGDIKKLCGEAQKYGFAAVCVNPFYVGLCAQILKGSGIKVCTAVGFPLGCTTSSAKAFEARDAVENGADEVDMVMNLGAFKSGKNDQVLNDIKSVRKAVEGKVLKVIIETCCLTDDEKKTACRLAEEAGADFVKTSTGFSSAGAKPEDVKLMRHAVGSKVGVKASGGIRTLDDALSMIKAGAARIGTSNAVSIVTS